MSSPRDPDREAAFRPLRRSRSAALAVAGAALLAACNGGGDSPSEPSGPEGVDLLLVVVDTLRADRLGCYGWGEPTSPRVDRLASEGVLFEGMRAQAPQTQPSFASILTGTHPPTHGVRANGVFSLPPEATTLAEILRDRGYRTGAVLGGFPLDARFGFDQGFESYLDEMSWDVPMRGLKRDPAGSLRWVGHRTRHFENSAEAVTDRALAWLEDAGADEAFFLLVHYFDPHHDYLPPPGLAGRFAHPYAGEVAKVDRELGRLLDGLDRSGRAERTLVAFTADHGECLGEHGRHYHQQHLVEAVIRVPCILRLPHVLPAGRRVRGLCRSVDLLPTMLELLDVEPPPGVEGRSLGTAIRRGSIADGGLAYFETLWGKLESDAGVSRRALTDGRWKLIHNRRELPGRTAVDERFELYDLERDPDETRDLSAVEPQRVGAWSVRLEAFEAAHPARRSEPRTPDPDVLERLRALGYH